MNLNPMKNWLKEDLLSSFRYDILYDEGKTKGQFLINVLP